MLTLVRTVPLANSICEGTPTPTAAGSPTFSLTSRTPASIPSSSGSLPLVSVGCSAISLASRPDTAPTATFVPPTSTPRTSCSEPTAPFFRNGARPAVRCTRDEGWHRPRRHQDPGGRRGRGLQGRRPGTPADPHHGGPGGGHLRDGRHVERGRRGRRGRDRAAQGNRRRLTRRDRRQGRHRGRGAEPV